MTAITSRIVPVGVEYAVEFETEHLDLRYGPYPTLADAEIVRRRITESLAGVTARQGITSPAGAPVRRPVEALAADRLKQGTLGLEVY